jgi:8-hydroxy-5-deazaflavin:NADPH oxidoreductase
MIRIHFCFYHARCITPLQAVKRKTEMRIAILGVGNVGWALARAWAKAGHDIVLGLRDTTRHQAQIAETRAQAMSLSKAAASGDVIVLALPWTAAETALAGPGDLSGRIVIDAMKQIARTADGPDLDRGHTTSGAETVATWLPGARIVKTLNQCGAQVMANNAAMSHRPAMFMASDDASAKAIVAPLLYDLGFDPMDAGNLAKASLRESLAMVWINQSVMRGKGRNWALAALPNPAQQDTP